MEKYKKKYLLFGVIVFCGVLLDQIIKFFARTRLDLNKPMPIIGDFLRLTYLQNRGAGFGILHDKILFIMFVSVIVLAIMFLYLDRIIALNMTVAVALLFAGVLGNLIDRLVLGFVVDYIDITYWAVFNMADILITVGSIILIWQVYKQERKSVRSKK